MSERRYGRCVKCREFRFLAKLAKLECPSCMFVTYRCADCGGEDGALRSIRVHFSWFRTKGEGVGNHVPKVYALLMRLAAEEERTVA